MSALPKPPLTPDEYLAAERLAEFKSEYVGGVLRPRDGANRRHCTLTGNFTLAVWTRVERRSCEIYSCDLRLRAGDGFFYPDAAVSRGPAFLDTTEDVLLNPVVLVEVMSAATADYDRSDKFLRYRRLPSLREYVLIDPDRLCVERWVRLPGESWLMTELTDPAEVLSLDSLGLEIPLAELYEGVEPFADQPTA